MMDDNDDDWNIISCIECGRTNLPLHGYGTLNWHLDTAYDAELAVEVENMPPCPNCENDKD